MLDLMEGLFKERRAGGGGAATARLFEGRGADDDEKPSK